MTYTLADNNCRFTENSRFEITGIPRDSCIIIVVTEGVGIIEVDSQRFAVRQGYIGVLNTRKIGDVRLSAAFSCNMLIVPHRFSENIFYKVTTRELWAFLERCPLFPCDNRQFQMLRIWLSQIEWTFCYCFPKYAEELLRNQFHNFFIALDSELQRYGMGNKQRIDHHSRMVVSKFLDFVSRNYTNHRDVGYYADKLCISTSYLNRMVRETIGKSPKEVIDGKIVTAIKDMLAGSDKSIKIIAAELHFPDASYLSRYFIKLTGITPTEFRTKHN